MTTPIGVRTAILAAKLETTLGTSIALAAADAGFRVMNPMIKSAGSAILIPASTGNADIGAVLGQYSGEMSFDVQLYEGNWRTIFLPSVGFDDSASTDVWVFTDDSTKWKGITGTLWYGAAKKYGLFGAMGSLSLKMPVGQPGTASFRYKGCRLATPGTLPTGITWESSLPPVFAKTAALTIASNSTVNCSNVEVVSDDYAFLIPSPNVAGAYANAWLKKPSFKIRVDPLQLAADDWETPWLNTTPTTITAVVNAGTGNTITVSASAVLIPAPDRSDQDEQVVTPLEFAVLNNSLSITFN